MVGSHGGVFLHAPVGSVSYATWELRASCVLHTDLSIGSEAAALHGFHAAREAKPHQFKNRYTNKLKIVLYGAPKTGVCAPCVGQRPPRYGAPPTTAQPA